MADTSTNKVNKRNNIVVVVLAALLLGMIGLYFYERSGHQEIVQEMNMEKDSLKVELQGLVLQYDSVSTEYDSLNVDMERASTKVKALLTEIEQVKKASYRQISQYKGKVETMHKIMRNYMVQIDSLNRRNEQLVAENTKVRKQISQVKREKSTLQKSNESLKQRVALAATLNARALHATGINGKGKDMTKAKKSEQIKVSFILSENITAKRGTKKVYIRIMRPDQVLLVNAEKNKFQFEDLKIPYSAVREVEYEGKELPVNIYWNQKGRGTFQSGTYTVHVFTDGKNIGECTFTMK